MKLVKPNVFKKRVEKCYDEGIGLLKRKNHKLFPYQEDGVKWLISRELNNIIHKGGILADDMGLGKTIQMITLLLSNRTVGTTLLIVPPSLVSQWYNELIGKTNFRVGIFQGRNRGPIILNGFDSYDVLITTYGMIAKRKSPSYQDILKSYQWGRIVLDEGHIVRNKKTKMYKGLLEIEKRICWILTGTPVHNKINDIVCLLGLIGLEKENYPGGTITIDSVKSILKTYLLRRTKDILLEENRLVKMDLNIVPVELEGRELELYYNQHNQTMRLMERYGLFNFNYLNALVWLNKLRQTSIHPQLLINSYNRNENAGLDVWDGNESKFQILLNMIHGHRGEGALVFCYYTEEINRLYSLFKNTGLNVLRYDGTCSQKEKEEVLSRTRDIDYHRYIPLICSGKNSLPFIPNNVYNQIYKYCKTDVLVMQIQSGSVGLNLQKLNRIYFTSPHWNPAIEDQAIGRCYRYGQKKPVIVTKLISTLPSDNDITTTFEQRVLVVQREKRNLQAEIFEDERLKFNGTVGNAPNKEDMVYLLGN